MFLNKKKTYHLIHHDSTKNGAIMVYHGVSFVTRCHEVLLDASLFVFRAKANKSIGPPSTVERLTGIGPTDPWQFELVLILQTERSRKKSRMAQDGTG